MNDFLIYSVEDDHEIANLIRLALEKSDFDVRCFDDGESFLKTFEIKKPNLILLDLMLPGIQGNEILNIIRKDIDNDKIPIIILSAKSLLEDRISGLNNGDFEPGLVSFTHEFTRLYIVTDLYFKIFESYLSEVASRRNAMDNADKNAKDLIEKLTLEFNKARQASITQEITEVVNGSANK